MHRDYSSSDVTDQATPNCKRRHQAKSATMTNDLFCFVVMDVNEALPSFSSSFGKQFDGLIDDDDVFDVLFLSCINNNSRSASFSIVPKLTTIDNQQSTHGLSLL